MCGWDMRTINKIKNRNKYHKNEIKVYADFAKIFLYNDKNEEIGFTLIDSDFVEIASKYKWHTTNGYVLHSIERGSIFLHHLVMGFDKKSNKDMVCDHINRDRKDNRRENLRIATNQENAINKGKQSNNTSGYPGVHFGKRRGVWEASIKINRVKINLGRFDTREEAIDARIKAEKKYFGYVVNREYDVNTVFK